MVAIIVVLLYAMKAVVTVESQAAGQPPLRPLAWFAFAALWFGMRPNTFSGVPGPPRRDARELVWHGLRMALAGALLIAGARCVWMLRGTSENILAWQMAATLLLIPGLSLFMHFGGFNILAGCWRAVGAEVRPLFRAPLRSKNLVEFWGKRWNLAFSEMTAVAIFRPLEPLIGRPGATFAAFLFSGFVHELGISVPVQAGYGLPTLYFLLHGLAMWIERRLERAGRPIHRKVWFGRVWTAVWIVLPLPLLFHRPFLEGCVWPLIGM